MSKELKVYHCNEWHNEYTEFYLKDEADKVIADLIKKNKRLANKDMIMASETIKDLEESHKMEVEQLLMEIVEVKKACNDNLDWCLRTLKENRHQKYKRCLAMAGWCESEEKRLEAISPIFDTDKECWEYCSDYWARWHERWLELAEKFKEEQ